MRAPFIWRIVRTIAPEVKIKELPTANAYYDVEEATIYLPDLYSREPKDVLEAIHETFHAKRHADGHPFYVSDLGNWDEEAIEEERVNNLSEAWALNNLNFSSELIHDYYDFLRAEAIRPRSGYVSRYPE